MLADCFRPAHCTAVADLSNAGILHTAQECSSATIYGANNRCFFGSGIATT